MCQSKANYAIKPRTTTFSTGMCLFSGTLLSKWFHTCVWGPLISPSSPSSLSLTPDKSLIHGAVCVHSCLMFQRRKSKHACLMTCSVRWITSQTKPADALTYLDNKAHQREWKQPSMVSESCHIRAHRRTHTHTPGYSTKFYSVCRVFFQ